MSRFLQYPQLRRPDAAAVSEIGDAIFLDQTLHLIEPKLRPADELFVRVADL